MIKRLSLRIKPVIEGEHVTALVVGDEPLPLKKPIPLTQFPNFIQILESISEYVDFAGKSTWIEQDLTVFFISISDRASMFFELLSEKGDWAQRETILSKLNVNERELAGILSSPGQYFSKKRKDPLYESDWKVDEKGGKEHLFYRLKPKYLELVRNWFGGNVVIP